MDIIFNIPFVIKITATLVVILIVNRLFKNLLLSVVAGTLVLAFWSGHTVANIVTISWTRFISDNNLFLMMIIFQVICLSSQMQKTGVMSDLVTYVKSRISQKKSMAVLPAIIGLLPMPGGALFSAPMVDDCDHNNSIDNHLKTKTNYWFRHIWEYWWPLYPGVLLAIEITKIPLWQMILLQFPLSLFSIIGGSFFLLRHIKSEQEEIVTDTKQLQFIGLVLPIFIIILVYAFIMLFLQDIAKINKYLPMVIGLLISQVMLQFQRPLKPDKWKTIFYNGKTFKLVFLIALLRIYGAFIEATLPDNTPLMKHVQDELMFWQIPIAFIIMLLPFISGVTTGVAVGFVGASFPIVVQLLGTNPAGNELLAYAVLAYGFGYIGMMLSPVHVCLIVTNDYFKTSLPQNLFHLLKPASVVLIGTVALFFILMNI